MFYIFRRTFCMLLQLFVMFVRAFLSLRRPYIEFFPVPFYFKKLEFHPSQPSAFKKQNEG